MTDPIPAAVRCFLRCHFTSVSQLQVLTLLVDDRQGWTAGAVSAHLRLPHDHASHLLDDLVREGLLAKNGDDYEFHPQDVEAAEIVEELVPLYRHYRHRIVTVVFSEPDPPARDGADRCRPPTGTGEVGA